MCLLLVRNDRLFLFPAHFAHFIHTDEKWKKLRAKRDSHKSVVENYELKLSNATTEHDKKKYKRKIKEAQHLLNVAELRTDARKLEVEKKKEEAADLNKKADDEERLWTEKHPPHKTAASASTSAAAPTTHGASVRQSGPQVVVRSPTASSSTGGQSKKGSSSGASAQSQNAKGPSSAGKPLAQQKKA